MPSKLPDDLPLGQTAFFIDFDGTLARIVADPALAAATAGTLASLDRLSRATAGAVAVVSGRSMEQLDRMLHPLRLPLAGVHGLERRGISGDVTRVAVDGDAHERLAAATGDFATTRPGLLAEVKPGSVALHYRKRPELERECIAFARLLMRADERIKLVEGKKVIEMKLADRTKGDAIAEFMSEAPFRGRRPFFAGDDVTDEAGFSVVNAMGGISVKVGPGKTLAPYRVNDTDSFAAYLARLAESAATS